MLKKATIFGNKLTRIISGVLAVIFLLYGLLMLWDMYRTEIRAFASYDLLQYRPNIENDELPFLDDLLEINPDTRAWITIYNTNIDYPVMQGKDDMEYLNKDVYGNFALTGSIYESYKYPGDFSAPYTLIYGHHVANGSMFGDIEKFLEKDFFDKNTTGILILPDIVYDLEIIGILETNAYDASIFDEYSPECLDRCKYRRDVKIEKIIALSTCDTRATDARNILFCNATVRTKPLPSREDSKSVQREAIGHPMAGAYWSLLNLIILVATVYSCIRLLLFKDIKIKKILTILLGLLSIVLFFLTEDLHKPVQLLDIWTIPMFAILVLMFFSNKSRKDNSSEGA